VQFKLGKGDYTLHLRVPEWSRDAFAVSVNGVKKEVTPVDGFIALSGPWADGDAVTLELDVSVQRVYASLKVTEDIGKVCLQKGPLVFCAEEADNGPALQRVFLPRDAEISLEKKPDLLDGVEMLTVEACELADEGEELYRKNCGPSFRTRTLKLIPYYAWANRGEGEMSVWFKEKM